MPQRTKARVLSRAEVRALPWPAAVLAKDTPLEVAGCYDVGRIILNELDWTDTRARQDWSLRRLQTEVLTNASVSTLSRCVRVYRIAHQLGLRPPWQNLDMRHFVATASLPSAKQRQLLQKVERDGWSVQRLERLVKENYGSAGRGGKTSVECVRVLEQIEKRDLFSDLTRLNVYSRGELRKLAGRLQTAEESFRRLRRELRAFGV
jgi:ParB-like chromosome segregation protein Spo0J